MVRSRELEAYKLKLTLSDFQRNILYGLLLGDAHLETQNAGQTYRLKIEQSIAHKAYVTHLYEIFKEWVKTEPRERVVTRNNSVSTNITFQTLSHGAFRFYAQQFYAEGKKQVPKLIHRWLTPEALSYWYMDDGSIKSNESKGVILNTHGFDEADVTRLCEVLKQNFNLEAKPRKQRDGIQIYISGDSFERFLEVVEPFIIAEMKYKIPSARVVRMHKE